jgi:hypothetical protein
MWPKNFQGELPNEEDHEPDARPIVANRYRHYGVRSNRHQQKGEVEQEKEEGYEQHQQVAGFNRLLVSIDSNAARVQQPARHLHF